MVIVGRVLEKICRVEDQIVRVVLSKILIWLTLSSRTPFFPTPPGGFSFFIQAR